MPRLTSNLTADRLKAWRQRLGYKSQRAAAEDIGLSLRQYAAYERGEVPIPKSVALACVALAYGLPEQT